MNRQSVAWAWRLEKAASYGAAFHQVCNQNDLPLPMPNRAALGRPARVMMGLSVASAAQDRVWSSDITYIATDEGWLYLAAVINLFSRQVVGWSMQPHTQASLVYCRS